MGQRTSKDAWGNLTGENWPGGIVGTHTSYASTGQLKRQQWKSGATLLDQIDYAYDSFGNLVAQTVTQAATTSSESYTYDGLQRLTRAARSGVPSSPAAVTYGYTPSGNLGFKSDISLGSAGAYVYGLHGCGPHGVSEVQSNCGGTGSLGIGGSDPNTPSGTCLNGVTTTVYQCDASGNVVDGAVVGRYDFENRPWAIERPPGFSGSVGTAAYQYAASGDRFEEMTSTRTTWYGAAGFERSVDAQTTDRIELGPVTLTKIGSTTTARPNLQDRLGSTVAIGNTNGTLWQARSYDAFGKPRNGDLSDRGTLDLSPPTLRGFTGHEHVDEVRLIHMNGRVYDPALGRFLSVDPIIGNALNTQAINPYSYVGNNPLSGIDPTGYAAVDTESICFHSPGSCGQVYGTDAISALKALSDTRSSSSSGADHGITTKGAPSTPTSGSAADIGKLGGTLGDLASSQTLPVTQMETITIRPTFDERFDEFRRQDAWEFVMTPAQAFVGFSTGTNPWHVNAPGDDSIESAMIPGGWAAGLKGVAIGLGVLRSATRAEEVFGVLSGIPENALGPATEAFNGYRSFSAFKRAEGAAGAGMHWHHIVEQTPSNVSRFGPEAIHNTSNLVRLDIAAHRQISGFYSSIQPQITSSTNMTIRQWLGIQSYESQRQFGREILQQYQVP